jgi:hypothetical protein
MGDFVMKDFQEIWGKKFDTTRFTLPKRLIYRSLTIMMTQIEDRYLENNEQIVLIRPDLSSISPFDLDTLDEALDI